MAPEPSPADSHAPAIPAAGDVAANAAAANAPPAQPRNFLHGMTLERIVEALAAHYGWDELGQRIPVRCFTHDPSVGSALKFLRKTPWAREKVEGLYGYMLRAAARAERGNKF